MKIILSRKGFDSSAGKAASFIIQPAGDLVSLPIPETQSVTHPTTYSAITITAGNLGNLGTIVSQLTTKRKQGINGSRHAHLDPDLDCQSIVRPPGQWIAAFGQRTPPAAQHLTKHGIGKKDVFLFFGWFKQISLTFPKTFYARNAPNLNVIFGYLQVEDVYSDSVNPALSQLPALVQKYPGLAYHPHLYSPRRDTQLNRVYVARQNLEIPGLQKPLPGAGIFDFDARRVLTQAGSSRRSRWLLRGWNCTSPGMDPPLYRDAGAWQWAPAGQDWIVDSIGYGQEFVIDTANFPDALTWLTNIF